MSLVNYGPEGTVARSALNCRRCKGVGTCPEVMLDCDQVAKDAMRDDLRLSRGMGQRLRQSKRRWPQRGHLLPDGTRDDPS